MMINKQQSSTLLMALAFIAATMLVSTMVVETSIDEPLVCILLETSTQSAYLIYNIL
jgi:hypothetical protein